MKNHYDQFTGSMKAFFWSTVILTFLTFVGFIIVLIPGMPHKGYILIVSAVFLFLIFIFFFVLAFKIWKMNKSH